MKALFALFAVSLVTLGFYGCADFRASRDYDISIGSYWDLSIKASTLDAKADYLNRFVAALDSAQLAPYDALFYQTPNVSTLQNLATLRTLQKRMSEIRGMDIQSFQYQQAISQITAQEQDEGSAMIGVLRGAWFLENHRLLWGWISAIFYFTLIVGVLVGGFGSVAIWIDA